MGGEPCAIPRAPQRPTSWLCHTCGSTPTVCTVGYRKPPLRGSNAKSPATSPGSGGWSLRLTSYVPDHFAAGVAGAAGAAAFAASSAAFTPGTPLAPVGIVIDEPSKSVP